MEPGDQTGQSNSVTLEPDMILLCWIYSARQRWANILMQKWANKDLVALMTGALFLLYMGTVYTCWTLLANTPPAVADSARRPSNHRGSAPVWLSQTWKETPAHKPSSSFLLRRCSEWLEQTMQMTLTFKLLHMMQVVLLNQLAASGVFSVGRSNQILYSRWSRNTNMLSKYSISSWKSCNPSLTDSDGSTFWEMCV